MTNYEKIIKAFENCGYKVSFFEEKDEAAEYLLQTVRGYTVGFGDSLTLASMHLAERLSAHNEVIDPSKSSNNDEFLAMGKKTLTTDIFFTSVNAAAQSGELVNIDGTGNRIAGSIFGHKKVYFVFGTNKLEPTLNQAIWRARNIAGPRNAKRLGYKTPCAVKGDRCYDCSSPGRICNTMTIHFKKMNSIEAEIILIDENLGL